MFILTESHNEELIEIGDRADRMHAVATHMASIGIRIFPARAFDGEAFDAAFAEYEADLAQAKAEKRKPKYPQKHYKQHGGKAPAEGLGDQYKVASVVLAQIDKWWHPTKGKYRGNNICVSTGKDSGLIVVDLDVKPEEGVDGFEWWNRLIDKHGDVDTFRVRSGGQSVGGQHLYFRYREGVETRNGLAPGVDIRVERSHVVAPFSQCQGTYEAITFDEVAEVPDWLYDALTSRNTQTTREAKKTPSRGSGDISGDAEDSPAFALTPLDQIEEMLSYLDPYDPDIDQAWKQLMYAIHSEHPTDEALAIFQKWSARNPERFDEANNEDMWKRANEEKARGVSIATLYHHAENAGWINPKRGATYVDVSRAVRMMNRSFAIIDPDRYADEMQRRGKKVNYQSLPPCFYPPMVTFKTKTVLSDEPTPLVHRHGKVAEVNPEQMAMMASRYKVLIELPSGKMKVASLRETWMSSPARRSYLSAGYFVTDKNCPEGVLNLFPGWQAEPKEGVPERFLAHLRDILCDGDEERMYWLMNRLAYMIQFGDQVVPTGLVVAGAQGAGKSIVGDYLERMIGTLNYKYLHDAEALRSRFSEELVGKFLIVADEAIFSGDEALRNKLKSMVAAKNLREEGKGKAAKDAQNVMFLIIFSNEEEPVGIEAGDRRFSVFKPNDMYSYENTKDDPEMAKKAKKYFNSLVAEMNGDGPSQLLKMLMEWDVDKAVARVPLETEEKQGMIETRLLKTDTLLAYFHYLYATGFGSDVDENDPNPSEQRWGGRIRTGTFYEDYIEWVKEQKVHHRNSGWKAEPLNKCTARVKEDFECRMVKPSGKSFVILPTVEVIKRILTDKIPLVMKGEVDPEDYKDDPADEVAF